MRFLLNMNVSRRLGRSLKARGHECRHAADIGMAAATDREIAEESRKSGETIITEDLDYGDLLAFAGESSPSVIIFRLQRAHPDRMLRRIVSAWSEMEGPLRDGAIVLIEDAAIRIRMLPIVRED